MAFVGAIVCCLIYYLLCQSSLKANIQKIDLWGSLMMANLLVILHVIVAFWYEVNLIDTLWRLAFLTPVTLFIFNKGLAGSATCDDI